MSTTSPNKKTAGQRRAAARGITARGLPKADRPPSLRNVEIYKLDVIGELTHSEIARLYKVSRPRVSVIVQRVRNWYLKHHEAEITRLKIEHTVRLAKLSVPRQMGETFRPVRPKGR